MFGVVFFVFFPYKAFGKGKTEDETKMEPLNTEWVFCVTAFDVSALPPGRRIIGEVLAANLVASLKAVDYRIRVFPEYTFYEGMAWSKARLEAGKRLTAKREQRDLLLYQGNPAWRYRKLLDTANKEIIQLEEAFQKTEALIPEIGIKPAFRLTTENDQGVFPAAPESGRERQFCGAQKADGFLTAKVSEFHGRLYIVLRVYAYYAGSYIYEDSDIFSPDDLIIVADELSGRLTAAIAGTEPAAVQVTAAPENAMILVNNTYAGRGKTEIIERSPGQADVTVYAEHYNSATVSLELTAGELAELSINLTPLAVSVFNVELPFEAGGSLYRGSLYSGESPQSLELAVNTYEYLRVDTPEGKIAQAVIFAGLEPDTVNTVVMRPRTPKGKTDVDTSRRRFYGAYGRFWIALPVAYVILGTSNAITGAYNRTENIELFDKAQMFYNINLGTMIVAGGFLLETFIREAIYLVTSTRHEPRLARTRQN
jgi:hypothetical protein